MRTIHHHAMYIYIYILYHPQCRCVHMFIDVKSNASIVSRVYCMNACTHPYNAICWPLPSNQSFYRQIAGYQRGVGDHRVD